MQTTVGKNRNGRIFIKLLFIVCVLLGSDKILPQRRGELAEYRREFSLSAFGAMFFEFLR